MAEIFAGDVCRQQQCIQNCGQI